MDFRRPNEQLVAELRHALRRAGNGEGVALRLDPRDTSFLGVLEEVPEAEVIDCVKSCPMHY